jgi:hypothetical protein
VLFVFLVLLLVILLVLLVFGGLPALFVLFVLGLLVTLVVLLPWLGVQGGLFQLDLPLLPVLTMQGCTGMQHKAENSSMACQVSHIVMLRKLFVTAVN